MPSTCVLPEIAANRVPNDCCSAVASLAKHVRQKTLPGLLCRYKSSMTDSRGISHERSTCPWF
jgi:hypothetical protein